MRAEKFIERKREGEYETVKFHVIEADVDKDALEDYIWNDLDMQDDYETAYGNGVCFSWDDLYSVRVEKFLSFLEDKVAERKEEGIDDEIGTKFLQTLTPYKGYILCFVEPREYGEKKKEVKK